MGRLLRGAALLALGAACGAPVESREVATRAAPLVLTTTQDFGAGAFDSDLEPGAGELRRGDDSYGAVTGWSLSSAHLSVARDRHQALVIGDRLFVLGGRAGAVTTASVESAPLTAPGVLGPFTAATALPSARSDFAAVGWAGRLYVLGGCLAVSAGGACTTPTDEVWVADVGAGGGLSPWRQLAPLPAPRLFHAAVAHRGFLHVLGGQVAGVDTSTVLVAALDASGVPGAWQSTAPFNVARRFAGAAGWNGQLVLWGGTGAAARADVQTAALQADGTLQAWATSSAVLPSARGRPAGVVHRGHLVVAGGEQTGGGAIAEVAAAALVTGKAVGAFSTQTPLPAARTGAALVADRGAVFLVGGGPGPVTDVMVATLSLAPTPTAPGAFTVTTPLPDAGQAFATAGWGAAYYVTGGCLTGDWNGGCPGTGYQDTTLVGAMRTDGTIGGWSTSPQRFAVARDRHCLLARQSHLYLLGGRSAAGDRADVQVATIFPDAGLGPWQNGPVMPSARQYARCLEYGGRLYVVGGQGRTDVLVASFLADAGLSAWQTTSSFSVSRIEHQAFAANGVLSVVGGWTTTSITGVEQAPILADGTLGPFDAGPPLPQARSMGAYGQASGTTFIIGGLQTASGNVVSAVTAATAPPGAGLGAWANTTRSFSVPRMRLAGGVHGGFVYAIGGSDQPGLLSTVEVAPLVGPARLAEYTTVADLGGLSDVTSVTVNGATSGQWRLTVRVADGAGLFGPPSSSALTPGVAVALSARTSALLLTLQVDDTAATSPALSTITDVAVVGTPVAVDGGQGDGGAGDGGQADAGAGDAGTSDAGASDAGASDAGASGGGGGGGVAGPGGGSGGAGAGGGGGPGPLELGVGCGCQSGPVVPLGVLLLGVLRARSARRYSQRRVRRR